MFFFVAALTVCLQQPDFGRNGGHVLYKLLATLSHLAALVDSVCTGRLAVCCRVDDATADTAAWAAWMASHAPLLGDLELILCGSVMAAAAQARASLRILAVLRISLTSLTVELSQPDGTGLRVQQATALAGVLGALTRLRISVLPCLLYCDTAAGVLLAALPHLSQLTRLVLPLDADVVGLEQGRLAPASRPARD